jgi:hypothetical protein
MRKITKRSLAITTAAVVAVGGGAAAWAAWSVSNSATASVSSGSAVPVQIEGAVLPGPLLPGPGTGVQFTVRNSKPVPCSREWSDYQRAQDLEVWLLERQLPARPGGACRIRPSGHQRQRDGYLERGDQTQGQSRQRLPERAGDVQCECERGEPGLLIASVGKSHRNVVITKSPPSHRGGMRRMRKHAMTIPRPCHDPARSSCQK